VETLTSIEDLIKHITIDLFPQPSKGNLNLKIDQVMNKTIGFKIYNLQGHMIQEETAIENTLPSYDKQINVSHLPTGLYWISLQIDKYTLSRKISIQH